MTLQARHFVIGSDLSGDAFVLSREPLADRPTPPVFRIDHEIYSEDEPDESLTHAIKQIADDLIEFIEPLIPSEPPAPPEAPLESALPCSRCGSMRSIVIANKKKGKERFCFVCGHAEPFIG